MADLRDLTKLTWPFPDRYVKDNPGGRGTYVAHPLVEQRLLDVLGRPPITEVVHIIRGNAPAKSGGGELVNVIVGVVLRMRFTLDGEEWHGEEAGDCELPSNWNHDGARLKDAMSDAYKRVAMRARVALHLWAGDNFYIAAKLLEQDKAEPPVIEPGAAS